MISLLALASCITPAMAVSAPFHGAAWSAFATKDATGCSAGTNTKAHWSKLTGIGSMYVTGHAKTCRGQPTVFGSSSTIGTELQVTLPVHLGANATGINVTWTLAATLTTTGGVRSAATCAPTRSNASYNLGYTWENYTSISYACYGLGSVSIGGSSWIDDLTTGVLTPANNSWNGVANYSGLETYAFADRYNYSNASYWGYNSSYSFSQNHSYGLLGLLAGRWSPTWFLNGTFTPTDRYVVVTAISITAYSEAFGYAKAYGSGIGDLRNGPNLADLSKVVIW